MATLISLLAGLTPNHRKVLFEVYVRDRPIADVANDLGIPSGTVESRCHNALHQFRVSTTGHPRYA